MTSSVNDNIQSWWRCSVYNFLGCFFLGRVWSAEIGIPCDTDIEYRYFIASVDPQIGNDMVHVRKWETHLKPRHISKDNESQVSTIESFGIVDGIEKLDRGWLTNETVLQFKFFNNPFHLKERVKNRLLYVKVIVRHGLLRPPHNRTNLFSWPLWTCALMRNLPAWTKLRCRTIQERIQATNQVSDVKSGSVWSFNSIIFIAYAFSQVATLNGDDFRFQAQQQFGRAYQKDDILMFHVTVTEPENIAYLIDLYTYSSRADDGEPPYHLGYHYLLPNLLKKSEGQLELPITCATKHRPLGMMKMEFVKMTPLNDVRCDLKVIGFFEIVKNFLTFDNISGFLHSLLERKAKRLGCWSSWSWNFIQGHQWWFNSWKHDCFIKKSWWIWRGIRRIWRSTVQRFDASKFLNFEDFKYYFGFNFKVIYHDFHVYVSLKKKLTPDMHDMLELPMRELTLEQLKNLKVYHVVEGRNREPKFFDEDLAEHQPFPELAEALTVIDEKIGFNIEIKWAQMLENGMLEDNHSSIDKNLYVDCILDVVLAKAGKRRIVFSCFDADICVMVRNKQVSDATTLMKC